MRVLVTGGAGFIGSHVVDTCLAAGHEVFIADNLSTGRRENVNSKAYFHEVDICSSEFAELFASIAPDAVSHQAAQMDVTRSMAEPLFDARQNVLGTLGLLELCRTHEVRRLVFASTGGAIYGASKELPATEKTRPEPLSPYAVSKLAAEEYIRMYTRTCGLTHVILRYTNVFGPRQVPHGECGVCAVFATMLLEGRQPTLYGYGEPVRDYVYVEDVARANLAALTRGDNETFNVSTGRPSSVLDVFEALKKAIGADTEPLLKPLRTGEVQASLASNTKAQGMLGWTAEVSLEEGLANAVNALRNQCPCD